MVTIPVTLQAEFTRCLQNKGIPENTQVAYTKWLHSYLDFCHKYHFPPEHRESLSHVLHKFQEKRHTKAQQEQAAHAITLYYELLDAKAPSKSTEHPPPFDGTLRPCSGQAQDRQGGNLMGKSIPTHFIAPAVSP